MRHRKHTFKIGRTSAHRKALMANQVSSLIFSKEIRTTVTKAKEAKRVADKMISLAKKGTLHHRRLAISQLRDPEAVRLLFAEIAPKFADRKGGYTRIIRLGRRIGDSAELCILQLVGETKVPEKQEEGKTKEKKTTRRAKPEAKAEQKTKQETKE